MKQHRLTIAVGIIALTLLASIAMASDFFEKIEPGNSFHGFKVENLYLDAKNVAVGARLIHQNTGFTLDLFQIQSVPQAFAWINTAIYDDRGEPHTCEHLLLGKGSKGRYVASLEDMSLGRSTAYTSQIYTAYPFSSPGGDDIFFDLTLAKMDALIHPNFSDEEIRREVCNIGVTEDPVDGSLKLEEKGTIYTEMVSMYEKYWYYLYPAMDNMIYGDNHPLANISGGAPDSVRTMVPEDLWNFHNQNYQLNNMGFIATIPKVITPDNFLDRMDGILRNIDGGGEHPDIPRRTVELPKASPSAPPGEIRIVDYPGANDQEPGQTVFAWPPQLELDSKEMLLLKTFLNGMGGSQTSNLYNKLVKSDSRVRDLGATGVWAGVESDFGHAISVGISDVEVDHINKGDLADMARLIKEEVAAIAAYAPGSPELEDFNRRAEGYLENREKDARDYLNTPPGFGNRSGGGGRWYSHLKTLEQTPGFRKSLLQDDELAYARSLLAQKDKNIWTPLIAKWKMLDTDLYAVGARANPQMLKQAIKDKEIRLAAFTDSLKEKYGLTDDNEAIARYKEEYDRNTAAIDEETAKIPMPKFIDNPPMSYDPDLEYRVDSLDGVPLVSSNFNTLTSATVGLALDMHVIPADKLIYLPIIPQLITEIGVVKDGEVIDYPTMSQRLKDEVLRLNARFSQNSYTGRIELMIQGAGGDLDESRRALEWMAAGLFHPYLDPANLPRLRDVVDQQISRYRDRMKGSEEGWVYIPAIAYRNQTNPLILASSCFMTQHYLMHRLKWRLMEADNESLARECEVLFDVMGAVGRGRSRSDLVQMASTFGSSDPAAMESGPFGEFARAYLESSSEARDLALEALSDLAGLIGDVPEENASGDWIDLSAQMKNDLLFRPQKALEDLADILALLRNRQNARMFIVSNTSDRGQLEPAMKQLVAGLDNGTAPARQVYPDRPVVLNRMRSRYPGLESPTYVGLVNNNTRNGVFIYRHPCADLKTTDENKLLDYLTIKLYGGGGAHSMFMKTWSAGLAYSNGLRSAESMGLLDYYAERCPDLSVTMRFVVDELKKAPYDPKLAEYAVALTFGVNRGSNSYDSRGESMANDLADGITPEIVSQFRDRILDLRRRDDLYDVLHQRMESAYGTVLIGYGSDLASYPEGEYYIIGPEAQFDKLENYIASVESPQTVYRTYPRDYWIVE